MISLSDIVAEEEQLIEYMAYFMIFMAIITALALLLWTAAPYGRYYISGAWGPSMSARLGWIIQETPSLLISSLVFCNSFFGVKHIGSNHILLILYIFHYVHRTLLFPLLIRGGKPSPYMTVACAFVFCSYNGFMQSRNLVLNAPTDFDECYKAHFIIGVLLFFVGLLVNLHSDHILRTLRKPGQTGYKIPRGGMFDYVSGANFFGEIVEWYGFALAAWNLPALAFAVYTLSAVGPRSWTHHKWYLSKFEDYPKDRRALIPFLL